MREVQPRLADAKKPLRGVRAIVAKGGGPGFSNLGGGNSHLFGGGSGGSLLPPGVHGSLGGGVIPTVGPHNMGVGLSQSPVGHYGPGRRRGGGAHQHHGGGSSIITPLGDHFAAADGVDHGSAANSLFNALRDRAAARGADRNSPLRAETACTPALHFPRGGARAHGGHSSAFDGGRNPSLPQAHNSYIEAHNSLMREAIGGMGEQQPQPSLASLVQPGTPGGVGGASRGSPAVGRESRGSPGMVRGPAGREQSVGSGGRRVVSMWSGTGRGGGGREQSVGSGGRTRILVGGRELWLRERRRRRSFL